MQNLYMKNNLKRALGLTNFKTVELYPTLQVNLPYVKGTPNNIEKALKKRKMN